MTQVDGLNIPLSLNVNTIKIKNARLIERTKDGYNWEGSVVLITDKGQVISPRIGQAINSSTEITFTELNIVSQSEYSKDFENLTVLESRIVQGKALANKLVSAVVSADTGLAQEDVVELVTAIVSAIK